MTRIECFIVLVGLSIAGRVATAQVAVPATATFVDSLSIRSDGRTAATGVPGGPTYSDGVASTRVVFFDQDQGGSGHFRLDTYQQGLGPKPRQLRALYFDFGAPFTACGIVPTAFPGDGLRVTNLVVSGRTSPFYKMTGTQEGWATFYIDEGQLRFSSPPGTTSNPFCSTPVLLSRTSATSYEVSALPEAAALVAIGRQGNQIATGHFMFSFRILITTP